MDQHGSDYLSLPLIVCSRKVVWPQRQAKFRNLFYTRFELTLIDLLLSEGGAVAVCHIDHPKDFHMYTAAALLGTDIGWEVSISYTNNGEDTHIYMT